MATTWTYNDWRRESGTQAQRDRLILHIEEVEDRLAGFIAQGAFNQSAQRHPLQEYLERLEKKLAELESYLGLDPGADDAVFVLGKPLIE